MTKKIDKSTVWIILAGVAVVLIVAILTGAFKSPAKKAKEDTEPIAMTEAEETVTEPAGNVTGIDHGEIEFDEKSGEATNLEELEAKNPPKVEKKEFDEKPEVTEPEPKTEETAKPADDEKPISTGSVDAKQETTQEPQQTSGGSSGTAIVNGRSVRAFNSVSDLNGVSPQKPFETVSVNGVPYKWTGSKWADASQNYADTPNDYTEIGGLSGIQVGH